MSILTVDIPKTVIIRATDDDGVELQAEAARIEYLADLATDPLPMDPHRPGFKLVHDIDDWAVPFTDLVNQKYGTSFSVMQALALLAGCREAIADLKKSSGPGLTPPTSTETCPSSTPCETLTETCLTP